MMMQQPPRTPRTSALGGALAVIAVWLIGLAGVDVPTMVGAAFAVVITVGTTYLPLPRRRSP